MLARQQTYLPPILVSILLVIQANQLSGHRSRHSLDETEGGKANRDSNIGYYSLFSPGSAEWTKEWEEKYFIQENKEKDVKRKIGHREKRIKNLGFHKSESRGGKVSSKERRLSETRRNRDRK